MPSIAMTYTTAAGGGATALRTAAVPHTVRRHIATQAEARTLLRPCLQAHIAASNPGSRDLRGVRSGASASIHPHHRIAIQRRQPPPGVRLRTNASTPPAMRATRTPAMSNSQVITPPLFPGEPQHSASPCEALRPRPADRHTTGHCARCNTPVNAPPGAGRPASPTRQSPSPPARSRTAAALHSFGANQHWCRRRQGERQTRRQRDRRRGEPGALKTQ